MKTLISTLILGAGLTFSGCGNEELKRNTEIELYNQLLESYMTTEDSNFKNIIAHYKENVAELKECRDNQSFKEGFNGLEYNRGAYEIELKYIKEYSEIRESRKKEILEMSKKIKRDFDEL